MKKISSDIKVAIQENLKENIIDLLYMSKKENKIPINDLDYILVVRNESDIFEIIKVTSNLCVHLIERHKKFIGLFPIKISTYNASNSMFMQNVRLYGESIL